MKLQIQPSSIMEDVYRVCEHAAVKAAIGGSFEDRFRELSKCVILEDSKTRELAIFKFEMLDSYKSLVFDVERPRPFVWAVLDHMFVMRKAKKLTLYSFDMTAGEEYGATRLGYTWQPGGALHWQLVLVDYQASREARDARRDAA